MRTKIRRRAAVTLVAAIAAFPIVGVGPAQASESDENFIYSEACPVGYEGVIVGYDHPKFGSNAVYACTNIV